MASSEHQKPRAKPRPSGKKTENLSQKEQSERFIQTARELAADESGSDFDRAIGTVLRPARDHK
jgi:hypothetical protein